MNRYVKIEGYSIWFLVLEPGQSEPEGLSQTMQEKILLSTVCKVHNPTSGPNEVQRLIMAATRDIDYEALANKYGTILIQPVGSFMPLYNNKIVQETYSLDFPIQDYAEIVICENDEKAEYNWVKYLKKRFPDKSITTINFFSLRSEEHVREYFSKAEYITFSTTFTDLSWFEKLTRYATESHHIIGYCHDSGMWEKALQINQNVEIINNI